MFTYLQIILKKDQQLLKQLLQSLNILISLSIKFTFKIK